MTTVELYDVIGGDYEKMKGNLKTDERIARFARMFVEDGTFRELSNALEEKRYEEAFQAAHKLKGVSQNMFFQKMYLIVHDITEGLRNGADIPKAEMLFEELKEIYQLTIDSIQLLDV